MHELTYRILLVALAAVCGHVNVAQAGDDLAVDKGADPCVDFYAHACAPWMAKNPLPADQSRYGRFDEVRERNLQILSDILEHAAMKKERTADEQKIGDFYGACMAENTIEAQGLKPLEPTLARIAALHNKAELPALLASLHAGGSAPLFAFSSEPDMMDAKHYIAGTDQGGLSLPERDYYLRKDAKSVALRDGLVKHIAEMFRLAGDKSGQATAKAKTVLALETRLAEASLDIVARREPRNVYHPLAITELAELSPAFDWSRYFAAQTAAPKFDRLNVAVPGFVRGLDALLKETALGDLETYLAWQALHSAAPLLPARFVNADFAFFGKTLTGAKELKPRWKRCVQLTDEALGEALGKVYVAEAFGGESKQRVLAMVQAVEGALQRDIDGLAWMTAETKTEALKKLRAIKNKIGFPETWRDYSALAIDTKGALANAERANAFEVNRRLRKIGTAVDPLEWQMTPPTVNAYYDPLENNINFPAGILQPPFYSSAVDDALNYGGIGAVIGHELTHGFDDQGRQFDAEGNLRDWWVKEDATAFTERATCFVDQYSHYTAIDDVKLNGKLTLGENAADGGGLRLAYMAYGATHPAKPAVRSDGYTPEQLIFLGWAKVWCQNVAPEAARLRAQTDPHSAGRFRVNGVVGNMPEFGQAFGCKADAPMLRRAPCRIW